MCASFNAFFASSNLVWLLFPFGSRRSKCNTILFKTLLIERDVVMKSHFRFYFVGESRISLRGLAARVYFQGRRERSNEALVLTKAEPTTCHNSEWLMRGKKVEVHSKENIGEFLWGRFHNRMTSLFSSFARISVIKYITCRAYLFRWPAITLAQGKNKNKKLTYWLS